jgi:hypothetical protein
MMRRTGKVSDLIFGFAANSLNSDNPLIYVARVTEKLCEGLYYKSGRYSKRGDCIYRFNNGRFAWRSGAKHHGPNDLVHDLGKHPRYRRANVLLSTDFRYFGKLGTNEYKYKFAAVGAAIERLGQGMRVYHDPELRDELFDMADWVWQSTSKKKIGEPTNAPSRQICHRRGSCATA